MPIPIEENLIVSLSAPISAFERHLALEPNHRILFSGRFGVGKTFFLNHFFEEYKDEYLMIRDSPVQYTIASNEDILQFLRYDILTQLMMKGNLKIDFLNEKYAENDFILTYIQQYLPYVLLNMLPFIPKVGKPLEKGIKEFNDFVENLNKKREGYKKSKEGKAMDHFLQGINQHYLKQDDLIDEIIRSNLHRIKESDSTEENEFKTVLVLDDIDRIDPGHSFRLFNLFSAYFDKISYWTDSHDYPGNHFGFDHVVMVCDLENIRSTFRTHYGQETDFSGYIDKFYSQEVFYFDNREGVKSKVVDFLGRLDFPNWIEYEYGSSGHFLDQASDLLADFVIAGALSLRQLVKMKKSILIDIPNTRTPLVWAERNHEPISSEQLLGHSLFQFLVQLVGTDSFRDRVKKVINYHKISPQPNYYTGMENDKYLKFAQYLLTGLTESKHHFMPMDKSKGNPVFQFELEGHPDITFAMVLLAEKRHRYYKKPVFRTKIESGHRGKVVLPQVFYLILERWWELFYGN